MKGITPTLLIALSTAILGACANKTSTDRSWYSTDAVLIGNSCEANGAPEAYIKQLKKEGVSARQGEESAYGHVNVIWFNKDVPVLVPNVRVFFRSLDGCERFIRRLNERPFPGSR